MASRTIPPGPVDKYRSTEDLLSWMTDNFGKFGSIYRASVSGSNVYIVSEPNFADHILRVNWQNYKKGDSTRRIGFLLGNGLMVSEGEFWKHQRKQIQPAFHNGVVAGTLDTIRSANSRLLEQWILAANQKKIINVTRDVSIMTLEITLRFLFGADYDKVKPKFEILSSEPARDLHFMHLFRPLRSTISEIISERRANQISLPDVLGMLMMAQGREQGQLMPDGQIVSEIMTLIVAGHETTASTLAWVWHLLSEHPAVDQKLSAELESLGIDVVTWDNLPKFAYARQIIEEALRLYPPGWLLIRKAIRDDQLGDYFVPAGTEIYVSPYLIQRNPSLWDRADAFDPDRFGHTDVCSRKSLSTLPFSAGPRKCIGDVFARVEMELHLVTVARQLRLRQVSGDPTELEARVNLRCRNEFMVIPEIRCSPL